MMKRRRFEKSFEKDKSKLPYDVIDAILSRLPVKSLMRFCSVSKSWLCIISDPKFVKDHLFRATTLRQERIISLPYKLDAFTTIDRNYFCEKLPLPWKKYSRAKIYGSCNGLVLLRVPRDKMFVLWNPSTRASKKFSLPCLRGCDDQLKSGLCYDAFVDDYKVVLAFLKGDDYRSMVFSFKTNIWKDTGEFPYYGLEEARGFIVNGTLHWVVATRCLLNNPLDCDPFSCIIVYFDLREEVFKELPSPICLNKTYFHLAVLRERLCLYYSKLREKEITVWMMKEYGVVESWTRWITIPYCPIPGCLGPPLPLCMTEEDQIFCIRQQNFAAAYNYRKKSWIQFFYEGRAIDLNACTYVESLVLPTRETMTGRP